jgi:PAS domain S-box-containing protein
MSRLALAVVVVLLLFIAESIAIVLGTGDPASAASGVVQLVIVIVLLVGRRQMLLGYPDRGTALIVASVLAACVVMAAIPPPVPALAAAPIVAVAFSLSLLRGRRLQAALLAAWAVAVVVAVIVELVSPSPGLPPELAVASRVGTFAAVVGLVVLVLYRHRRRLDIAMDGVRAAGEALADSEARYRLLFEGLADAVFVHELDAQGVSGCLLAVNDAACRRLGYSRDELIGTSMPVTDGPDAPLIERDRSDSLLRGERVLFEQAHVAREGRRIPVEVHAQRFEIQGRAAVLSVARDISDRRQAETELRASEELLRQASRMESVGRLAGGIAHDFNNMLMVILGHTELVLEGLAAEDPHRADLEEIQVAARHSADLTRQLLTFARKQPIAPRDIDLNEVVDDTQRLLRRLIGEDIELVWRANPELWLTRVDPVQVEQVLTNLSLNARDAITGGGTITIEAVNVGPNGSQAGPLLAAAADHVRLSVRDNGCGMDPETLAHVFEPFYTTKGPERGTGLGLATVYGIALQNGGFVDAESAPGRGSTVSVFLPRSAATDPTPAPGVVGLSRGGTETILLVEDDPQLLRLGETMLRGLGYTVLVAANGAAAIEVAEGCPSRIDLLLTDVRMPGMSGPTLAATIRVSRPGISCLLVTGYGGDLLTDVDPGGPPARLLSKPYSIDELAVAVRDSLDRDGA